MDHGLTTLSLNCRLLPLTGEHGDEPCPKALLPISNKPMLDYPLSWVEQSGIKGGLDNFIQNVWINDDLLSLRCPSDLSFIPPPCNITLYSLTVFICILLFRSY